MPGPVSDSLDPEWGTGSNKEEIENVLTDMYRTVSAILGNKPPIYVLDLVRAENLDHPLPAEELTEKEWRLIRFALVRAIDSL